MSSNERIYTIGDINPLPHTFHATVDFSVMDMVFHPRQLLPSQEVMEHVTSLNNIRVNLSSIGLRNFTTSFEDASFPYRERVSTELEMGRHPISMDYSPLRGRVSSPIIRGSQARSVLDLFGADSWFPPRPSLPLNAYSKQYIKELDFTTYLGVSRYSLQSLSTAYHYYLQAERRRFYHLLTEKDERLPAPFQFKVGDYVDSGSAAMLIRRVVVAKIVERRSRDTISELIRYTIEVTNPSGSFRFMAFEHDLRPLQMTNEIAKRELKGDWLDEEA